MSAELKNQVQQKGCDTTYRASSLDTHPTHLCMSVFSHILRVRSGCACAALLAILAIPRLYEGAFRTLVRNRP